MALHQIEVKDAQKWLEKNKAILIDVREPAEHVSSHIEGATLMPLSQIDSKKLDTDKVKKVIIYCRTGNRSQLACEKLSKKHPEIDCYNLIGGIVAWEKAELPIKRSEGGVLPLDRQVQLTIGFCLILSAFLTYFVSKYFVFLTAFFGLGLSFAGLTGTCGLGMLIAKMPWNQRVH